MARSHKIKAKASLVFDAAKHAVGGLPQCAFCKHKFEEWTGLKNHIQKGHCHQIPDQEAGLPPTAARDADQEEPSLPAQAETLPPAKHPDAVSVVREKGWTALITSAFAEKLKQHCCFCNRWARDPTALKRHLSKSRPQEWKQCEPRLEPDRAQKKRWHVSVVSPSFLQSPLQAMQHIVWQCALIGHFDGGGDGAGTLGGTDGLSLSGHATGPSEVFQAASDGQAGKGGSVAGRLRELQLSEVERDSKEARSRRSKEEPKPGPDRDTHQPSRGDVDAPNNHEVQCKEASKRIAGGGGRGSVHRGGGTTKQGGSADPPAPPGPAGQCSVAASQSSTPATHPKASRHSSGSAKGSGAGAGLTGPTGEPLTRRRPPALPAQLRHLSKLKFVNVGNSSYINSTIFALLWQVHQRVDVTVPEAWRKAMQSLTWTPTQFLQFQLMGWRQPRRQHDASEFMQFILPRLAWANCSFSWPAKRDIAGDPRKVQVQQVQGAGDTHVMQLNPPDGLCAANFQDTIIELPRYKQTEAGIVKHRIPLNLEEKVISLPVFMGEDSMLGTCYKHA